MSQPLPLREQLKALENLQEIDLKVDSLKKNRGDMPAAIKALDDGVAKLRMSVEFKKNAITEIEKAQRQTQAAQDLNRDRSARASSKLEGVSNSQEFQAANKEIDQLKKLNGSLEEQTKKAILDIENLSKEAVELAAQLEKISNERESQVAQLNSQGSKIEKDVTSLTSERAQFVSKVEPRILSQYNKIRAGRKGIGIVPAIGGRCKGCNMMVPPQLFIEIQRGNQLHTCPSCLRILYVAPPSA